MNFNGKTMTAYGGFVEAAPQYELIEEINITEATDKIVRTSYKDKDMNEIPYNFSAIKIVAKFAKAESSSTVLFYAKGANHDDYSFLFYHTGQAGTIGTAARTSYITAYNDHGMVYYSAANKTSEASPNISYQVNPSYAAGWWQNVVKIGISPQAGATIPVGTKISIYAIRG